MIRSLIKDGNRPNRYADNYQRTSPWAAAHELLDGKIKESMVCVYYRRQDPNADEDSEEELFICIFMSMDMISLLTTCVAVCMDAKWRLNNAKAPMHALVSVTERSENKPKEAAAGKPRPAAFGAGYKHFDARELALIVSNRDNYWLHRVPFQALDRLMPCTDQNCEHGWRLVEWARGYYWERACQQPRQQFRPVFMLDKVAPLVLFLGIGSALYLLMMLLSLYSALLCSLVSALLFPLICSHRHRLCSALLNSAHSVCPACAAAICVP